MKSLFWLGLFFFPKKESAIKPLTAKIVSREAFICETDLFFFPSINISDITGINWKGCRYAFPIKLLLFIMASILWSIFV